MRWLWRCWSAADFATMILQPCIQRGGWEEIAPRGALDARGRGAAARERRNVDARRLSRDEQEGPRDDHGAAGRRTAGGDYHRWGFAPADGEASRRDAGNDRGCVHDAESTDDWAAGAGKRGAELDGEAKDHVDCGGGRGRRRFGRGPFA